jgi:hypothetical protein
MFYVARFYVRRAIPSVDARRSGLLAAQNLQEDVVMCRKNSRWPIAVAVAFFVGLVLSGFWPHTPLHAVSTDRTDTYAIATGPVDTEVEAVYLLDFLTGDLGAFVLGRKPGTWSGFFRTNVSRDLGVDPQKNPKYLIVTGIAGLRRAGGTRQLPSTAVCYVAEASSGRLAAYAIPWAANMYSAGQMQRAELALVGPTINFRQGGETGTGGSPAVGVPKKRGADNE